MSTYLVYSWVDINTQSNKPGDFWDFIEFDSNKKLITNITLFEHSPQCPSVLLSELAKHRFSFSQRFLFSTYLMFCIHKKKTSKFQVFENQSLISQVISKSAMFGKRQRFEITSMNTLWIVQHKVHLLMLTEQLKLEAHVIMHMLSCDHKSGMDLRGWKSRL